METFKLDHCVITSDDPAANHLLIEDGLVLTNGDQVKIMRYVPQGDDLPDRAEPVDRLFAATAQTRRGQVTFTGRSSHLDTVVRLEPEEQIVTVSASKWKNNCSNCG